MASLGDLTLFINAETNRASKDINDIGRQADKVSSKKRDIDFSLEKARNSIRDFKRDLQTVGDTAKTAFKVAKHYDRDGNGKVTQEEFDVGIKKLGACLGGSCPLYSWSAAAKASVFASPDPSITTLFPALSTAAFHAALVQANYSELQPATYRTLSITRITPTLSLIHI